ncbi:hypothetical protein AVEN_232669-1 [Araneus ventricosus]|uniref:Uncharacterized protein n=1 Tax=Araneus ventricosus TaxID=182803 RepID=A0A4Y2S4A0_ARAVE|nr:hypothetical protein AVEN_232669-1 [Araneus ventricosus]
MRLNSSVMLKMVSFSNNTRLDTGLPHIARTNMAGDTLAQASVIRFLEVLQCCGGVSYIRFDASYQKVQWVSNHGLWRPFCTTTMSDDLLECGSECTVGASDTLCEGVVLEPYIPEVTQQRQPLENRYYVPSFSFRVVVLQFWNFRIKQICI